MAISKLNISVGPITLPVRIVGLVGKGSKPSGSYVCSESQKPGRGTASGGFECAEEHPNACHRVIGYQRGDDSYFVPDEATLIDIQGESNRTIDISTFVPAKEVDCAYFDKTYIVRPDNDAPAQAKKAFWLLASRLKKLGRIGVGTATLDKDEKMVFLRYSETFDCLLFVIGCFDEQIERDKIASAQAERVTSFTKDEVALMEQVMTKVYVGPFVPEKFVPERWHALQALIAAETVAPKQSTSPVDLLATLKETVDRGAKTKKKVKS